MKSKKHSSDTAEGLLVIARSSNVPKARRRESKDRSLGEATKKAAKNLVQEVYLTSLELQTELSRFLTQFGNVFKDLPSKVGEYSIDAVEISVEVTAKGSVGLLGTGGEAGGKGGLKFLFKRKG